jgi:hemerythrin superfamily protein
MATVADPAKSRTKTPARPRKAAPKAAATAKAAPAKSAARKRVAPKTAAQKVMANVTTAEKSLVGTASHAVASIKATAEKATEASHVTDAAKAVSAKVRKVTATKPAPKRRTAPRKASTGVGTGTMIGVAAAGIAAGIAVNLGRKAAVQAPSVMAGDWLEALKGEHTVALTLLDKLAQSKPEQPAKRTMLLTQLKHALGKHAFTEENVIYPALREWGDKADADALNHEQGYHKQFLYELDGMDKAGPEFAQKVADFRADLNAHIREEEDKIFPKLHGGLSEEKNKALTGLANREGFKMA